MLAVILIINPCTLGIYMLLCLFIVGFVLRWVCPAFIFTLILYNAFMNTDLEIKVEEMIRPLVDQEGLSIVMVRLTAVLNRKTLQVMLENSDGSGVNIDQCTEASHIISAKLDVEDVISSMYDLEVGSAGIDRPLVKKDDFSRFSGYEIKATTERMVDGQKKFRGILKGINEDGIVTIEDKSKNADVEINYSILLSAKLVITKELLEKC
jgi:ribosome maturation factor RimP